ncbi:MAG TPA: Ig-like domain-containing protein, partial [Thermoanaerobaculia bacterium]|nr:Ig-like domain-containing protein [Thermoanaerobaculia bacterium]
MAAALQTTASAQTLTIDEPVFVEGIPFTITGSASPDAQVTVAIEKADGATTADATGHWSLTWTAPLTTGAYTITATSEGATATAELRVQLPGRLPRQSPFAEKEPRYGVPELPNPDGAQEMTDRWRIAPPPYELDEHSRGPLDPYNKNIYKGDFPFRGPDWFLVLTGISDSLAESRTLPTPSGPSSARPSSFPFFGDDDQGFFAENVIVSGDLFQGNTA